MTRIRVVQWTTGKTGGAAVRGMVGHPVLELVGCYAFSPDKVGRDVGTLAGIDPIGIVATDDIDALLALQPDCVSYMPYRPDFDHVVRILESGVNLVTTMYMMSGIGYGDDVHERIVDATRRGGVVALREWRVSRARTDGRAGGERHVRPHRPHLGARIGRHERLPQRADVPRHEHRPGARRPRGARHDRSELRDRSRSRSA